MTTIALMEYGTNKELDTIDIKHVPRIGEFFINSHGIGEDWKQKFFIVRAVTYTAGGHVVLHIERQDVDKIKEHEEKIQEKINELLKKGEKVNEQN